jgi:ribonuclease-3 family protein
LGARRIRRPTNLVVGRQALWTYSRGIFIVLTAEYLLLTPIWRKMFDISTKNNLKPEELPVLVLAYLGDAIYELIVRQYFVESGIRKINKLHAHVVRYVCSDSQAAALRLIAGSLSEAERIIVRRGRNAKSAHPPRGVDLESYQCSTALEALIGFLYLKKDYRRLKEIMSLIIEQQSEENNP